MRGGAREGAGRPKAAPTTIVRVRLTDAQLAAWRARGGDAWLKALLAADAAKAARAAP